MLTSLPEKFKERARITAQTGFLGMERVVKAWMKDDRAKIDSYMVSRASQREKKKRSQAFAAPPAGLNDHQPFFSPPSWRARKGPVSSPSNAGLGRPLRRREKGWPFERLQAFGAALSPSDWLRAWSRGTGRAEPASTAPVLRIKFLDSLRSLKAEVSATSRWGPAVAEGGVLA